MNGPNWLWNYNIILQGNFSFGGFAPEPLSGTHYTSGLSLMSCWWLFSSQSVRKRGSWSNKINRCRNKIQKKQNTRETQIYVVHPIWDTSTNKFSSPSFLLSKKMKGYSLQHIRCNFLFTLSWLLSLIHTIQFPAKIQNALIQKRFSF